jgi:hypothetical protein
LGPAPCDSQNTSCSEPSSSRPDIILNISPQLEAEINSARYSDRWFPALLQTAQGWSPVQLRNQGNKSRDRQPASFKVKQYCGYPETLCAQYILSSQAFDPMAVRTLNAKKVFEIANQIFDDHPPFLLPKMTPVDLYYGDHYQGFRLQIEEVQELFFTQRNLPVYSLYKARYQAQFTLQQGLLPEQGFSLRVPDDTWWPADLEHLLSTIDAFEGQDTNSLLQVLDVHQYLSYYAVASHISFQDGFNNNFLLHRPNASAPFQIIPWDLDQTFLTPALFNPKRWSNGLIEKLLAVPAWRAEARRKYEQLLPYTTSNLSNPDF